MSNSVGVSAISSPLALHEAPGDVHLEVAGLHDRRRRGERRGAPQQRADAREQLAGGERLGEVVVGALVQGRDLVRLVGAHGQDEDRRRHPGAQLAADLDAAAVGEHEVQHDEVRRRVDRLHQRLVRRGGHVERVAARGKDGPQRAADLLLVVDDQDVRGPLGYGHDPSSSLSSGPAGIAGRTITKRAPCGFTSSRLIEPPWLRTISRAIARPSPVPEITRSVAVRPR